MIKRLSTTYRNVHPYIGRSMWNSPSIITCGFITVYNEHTGNKIPQTNMLTHTKYASFINHLKPSGKSIIIPE